MSDGFIPPINYGLVEDDLHRSGMPVEVNFPYLETLCLKKVLCVSIEEPDPVFLEFLKEQSIEFEWLCESETYQTTQANQNVTSASTPYAWSSIPETAVLNTLRIILDQENYPLYIIDQRGGHRVGLVIGCLRRAQRWCLASIFEEYRRYTDEKIDDPNASFMELFDTDLLSMPPKPPAWYRPYSITY